MLYLVSLSHNDKIASMVADLPDDYSPADDVHLPSCSGEFTRLKQLLKERCPSGFHDCYDMLYHCNWDFVNVIAISKLQ